MCPTTQMDSEQLKTFIYDRVRKHPSFQVVIAVSVERYPNEFSVTVWMGREPDRVMREYAYALEAELANLGVPCSIIVKTDRELPLGGTYRLGTAKGEFSYRYYRIDPIKDEDIVYVFSVYQETETFRFRMSLSGTLASMLRRRNRLDEARIEEVYLDAIRHRIEENQLNSDEVREVMFDSRHIKKFVAA
jgi:hypothetical protein